MNLLLWGAPAPNPSGSEVTGAGSGATMLPDSGGGKPAPKPSGSDAEGKFLSRGGAPLSAGGRLSQPQQAASSAMASGAFTGSCAGSAGCPGRSQTGSGPGDRRGTGGAVAGRCRDRWGRHSGPSAAATAATGPGAAGPIAAGPDRADRHRPPCARVLAWHRPAPPPRRPRRPALHPPPAPGKNGGPRSGLVPRPCSFTCRLARIARIRAKDE